MQDNILLGFLPDNLIEAVELLQAFAGIFTLRFVSYVDDSDVKTRFRLETTFYSNSGPITLADQDFELCSADVNKLIRTLGDVKQWVERVDDLLHAKSDRTYLSRWNKIHSWDKDCLIEDERAWGVNWGVSELLDSRQLFANRLVWIRQNSDGTISKKLIGRLMNFAGQARDVELPCGHHLELPANHIQQMLPRDAVTACCEECLVRVMTKQDDRKLRYYRNRVHR